MYGPFIGLIECDCERWKGGKVRMEGRKGHGGVWLRLKKK